MPRPKLSLPHERRRAKLKSAQLSEKVRIAESREKLSRINDELRAMSPPKPKSQEVV